MYIESTRTFCSSWERLRTAFREYPPLPHTVDLDVEYVLLHASRVLDGSRLLTNHLMQHFLGVVPLLEITFELAIPDKLNLVLDHPGIPEVPVELVLCLEQLFARAMSFLIWVREIRYFASMMLMMWLSFG